MTDIGAAVVDFRANVEPLRRSLREIERDIGRSSGSAGESIRRIDSALNQSAAQARNFGSAFQDSVARATGGAASLGSELQQVGLALGLIGASTALAGLADQYTQIRAQLSLAISDTDSLAAVEARLLAVSQANRSGLAETARLYSTIRQSRDDLTDETATAVVEAFSRTLIVSGASAQQAAAATLQFAQALGSGRLQGDELRSLLENNVVLVRTLADGLGTNIDGIRTLGEQGALSTELVVATLLAANSALGEQAAQIPLTIGGALTQLQNAVLVTVGAQDQALGASRTFAAAVSGLAENVNVLIPALEALALVFVARLAGEGIPRLVSGLQATIAAKRAAAVAAAALTAAEGNLAVASTRTAVAVSTLRTALTGLSSLVGGPLGVAILAATAAWASYSAQEREAAGAADRLTQANERAAAVLERTRQALGSAGGAADEAVRGFEAQARAAAALTAETERLAAAEQARERTRLRSSLAEIQASRSGLERDLRRQRRLLESAQRGQVGRAAEIFNERSAGERARNAAAARDQIAAITDSLAQLRTAEALLNRQISVAANPPELDAVPDGPAELSIDAFNPAQRSAAIEAQAAATVRLRDAQSELVFSGLELRAVAEQLNDATLANSESEDELTRIIEGTRTAQEHAIVRLQRLALLRAEDGRTAIELNAIDRERIEILNQLASAEGAVSAEIVARATGSADLIDQLRRSPVIPAGPEFGDEFADTIERGVSDGLIRGVRTGDWGAAFGDILSDVTEISLRRGIEGIFDLLGGLFDRDSDSGGSGGAGSIFSTIKSFFGGARERGGPVEAGRAYLVGERRPELFVPNVSGAILPRVPDLALGRVDSGSGPASGVTVVTNIDARGATKDAIAELVSEMRARDQRLRAELPGMVFSISAEDRRRGRVNT